MVIRIVVKKKENPNKRSGKPPSSSNSMSRRNNYKQFLSSKYWKYVRKLVFLRDGRRCKYCMETNGLIIHHLTYKHHGLEHLFLQDLIVVCKYHHNLIHKTK